MSDDQVGCEWVSVSSGTGLPELSRTKAVCVCEREREKLVNFCRLTINNSALRKVLAATMQFILSVKFNIISAVQPTGAFIGSKNSHCHD